MKKRKLIGGIVKALNVSGRGELEECNGYYTLKRLKGFAT